MFVLFKLVFIFILKLFCYVVSIMVAFLFAFCCIVNSYILISSGYDKYNAIKTDPCLCFAGKLRLSGFEVEKNTSFSPEHVATEKYVVGLSCSFAHSQSVKKQQCCADRKTNLKYKYNYRHSAFCLSVCPEEYVAFS